MILTAMPDLPPRPLTAANAPFRERFYSRWGRENALVGGSGTQFEYATHPQTLSIKAAWGGGERYFLRDREVVVDDDHWLVLNHGRSYGSRVRAARPVSSLALFFRPGLPGEVAAQRALPLARALERADARGDAPAFSEHLRVHGDAVSRRLCAMWKQAQAGERSEEWLEQQSLLLMEALLDTAGCEPALARTAADTPTLSGAAAAHGELLRRLRRAADFIDSCHAEAIGLAQMAEVACLSRYHFLRHFRALYGITPYAYLLRKRARVAQRLLAAGEGDRERVALACGFGSRFALARALRRFAATPSSGAD